MQGQNGRSGPGAALALTAILAFLGPTLARFALRRFVNTSLKRLMTDPYRENLWELFSAGGRVSPQKIVETNLRASRGSLINRPLAGPRALPNFDGLVFHIAQLETLPTPQEVPIDLRVRLGKRARRPLDLEIPLIIGGMAYGLALNEKTKIALARAATAAGTATNTGEGPWLPAERRAAQRLIVQYARGKWSKDPEHLKQADMIEIQLGHGAWAGLGHVTAAREMTAKARRLAGLRPGEDAVVPARLPDITKPGSLRHLVDYLRALSGGVPIGVKIGAGKYLERDLAHLVAAGVDVIAVDGAQGATRGSPPIIQDDFGLPTVYALVRAQRFLRERGARDRVSLVIGGGLFTPGDFLKALALGADAVYLGTIALFALTHTQALHVLPWEPPTELVFESGRYRNRLSVGQAARHLANYLQAAAAEMAEGIRALGKTSVAELGPEDLMALDPVTAEATGIALAYRPP